MAKRRTLFVNRSLSAMLGHPKWQGSVFDEWREYMHPDDRKAYRDYARRLNQLRPGEIIAWEYRLRRADGTWLNFLNRDTLLLPERDPAVVVGVVSDITVQKAARERCELLMGEMRHRSKNVASLVSGIARLTRPTQKDEAIAAFDSLAARLMTIMTAGVAIIDTDTRVLPLAEVIGTALAPILGTPPVRTTLTGPTGAMLNEMRSGGMALIMHELATNALKHGALSVPAGSVNITWSIIDDGTLDLSWTELGGPPVVPPASTGFGTRVLRTAISDCDVELAYPTEGFRCRLRFKGDLAT